MSRVGKKPVKIPDKVKVNVKGRIVHVESPKGKLNYELPATISAEVLNDEVVVKRENEEQECVALHGTARATINNMVVGVSAGFSKTLEIIGIGYRAEVKGKGLVLQVGYSHPIEFPLPQGIEAKVDKQTRITISGYDKQLVGEVAAKVRRFRPPEPYKGKGVRYAGEVVKHKVGKAAVGTGV